MLRGARPPDGANRSAPARSAATNSCRGGRSGHLLVHDPAGPRARGRAAWGVIVHLSRPLGAAEGDRGDAGVLGDQREHREPAGAEAATPVRRSKAERRGLRHPQVNSRCSLPSAPRRTGSAAEPRERRVLPAEGLALLDPCGPQLSPSLRETIEPMRAVSKRSLRSNGMRAIPAGARSSPPALRIVTCNAVPFRMTPDPPLDYPDEGALPLTKAVRPAFTLRVGRTGVSGSGSPLAAVVEPEACRRAPVPRR